MKVQSAKPVVDNNTVSSDFDNPSTNIFDLYLHDTWSNILGNPKVVKSIFNLIECVFWLHFNSRSSKQLVTCALVRYRLLKIETVTK